MRKVEIEICMGSSCFARGNARIVYVVQEYIREHPAGEKVSLKGALCFGRCKDGPIIMINGKEYARLDGPALIDVLDELV